VTFTALRWRLVGWIVLVVCVLFVSAGSGVYLLFSHNLLAEIDDGLARLGERLGDQLRTTSAAVLDPDGDAAQAGLFYVVLGSDGAVVAESKAIVVPGALQTELMANPGTYATGRMAGVPVRLFSRRLEGASGQASVLLVGESLAGERAALKELGAVLLGGLGGGLLLAMAGAWFLSGKALVPAEIALERQKQFVADAAHELRTPLATLRSAHELLDQHRAEPLAANAPLLADIRAEIDRMERLTIDLLTLARADHGELELATGAVDLQELVREVVRIAAPNARNRGVRLKVPERGAPGTVEADPDRLRQVLWILIDNALKHCGDGGEIRMETYTRRRDVLVEVSDTGAGIAAQHLPRIFDRFYRTDEARSRGRGGAGLGLAIARSLVQAHGGRLQISSQAGVGTIVSVQIPRLAPQPGSERLPERLVDHL